MDVVCSFLLQLFLNESASNVRCAVGDVIAQIAYFHENWPELYPFIRNVCSQNDDRCIDGLYLLGEVGVVHEEVSF